MHVFRAEDRGRRACLKYINAQNSALWITVMKSDSQRRRECRKGLSLNGAPLHDVYLAQFPTLSSTLPFPDQCPHQCSRTRGKDGRGSQTDHSTNSMCNIFAAVSLRLLALDVPCFIFTDAENLKNTIYDKTAEPNVRGNLFTHLLAVLPFTLLFSLLHVA